MHIQDWFPLGWTGWISLQSKELSKVFSSITAQQYHLASMAARPSFTDISHHNILLHIPSICLSTVNSSPRPGIAPQSLNSSSQLLHLPGDLCHCLGYIWLREGLSDSHSIKDPQVSCFTLSLKCFSSDSDNCPEVGIRSLLQLPHPLRAGPGLLTPLFLPLVPSSYRVLHGSIYNFLQVRFSCLLSVFCTHFCVWRCVPDVSVERDVPQVHLLLCHLVFQNFDFYFWIVYSFFHFNVDRHLDCF